MSNTTIQRDIFEVLAKARLLEKQHGTEYAIQHFLTQPYDADLSYLALKLLRDELDYDSNEAGGDDLLYGLDAEWSDTDIGHRVTYEFAPDSVPVAAVARVIYELRLDIDRLNSESVSRFA